MPGTKSKKRAKSATSSAKALRGKGVAKGASKKNSVRETKTAKGASKKTTLAAKAEVKRAAVRASAKIKLTSNLGRVFEKIGLARPIEFRVSFTRPDDLLICDFIFDNFRLESARLIRKTPQLASTLVVELPPQSFGEQAFLDATGPEVAPGGEEFHDISEVVKGVPKKNIPVPDTDAEAFGPLPFAKVRMAGPSRLAFSMPADETELPYAIDAILDACRRWPMRLDFNALPEPDPRLIVDIPRKDLKFFDKAWLKTISHSPDWDKTREVLMTSLNELGPLERPLSAAAKRIAGRVAAALQNKRTRGLSSALARAMNEELDRLARKFPLVSEGNNYEAAVAALSLLTTQAVATGKGEFTLELIKDLPFLKLLLTPHQPSLTVTALELPYRVVISPVPKSNWWHETKPVVRNGRTELWHTRLTNRRDGIGAYLPTFVRALWSPDYALSDEEVIKAVNDIALKPPKAIRMSLDALDRKMLVKLMAGFNEFDVSGNPFVPHAARSQRLSLSALGALLDVEGNWNILPEKVGLEQWRHLANLGRDHYVRVVYRGFLFPSGHAASLIKVTERKFEYHNKTSKNRVAALRQRFFIVVREPFRTYDGAGHEFGGRNFPFTSVEVLTRVTPNLRPPEECMLGFSGDPFNDKIYGSKVGKMPHRACFWPMLGKDHDFKFQLAATDIYGARTTFPLPLLFVGVEANEGELAGVGPDQDKLVINEVIRRYNAEPAGKRRTASINNATVCYAPVDEDSLGDTRHPTGSITFKSASANLRKPKPRFYPEIQTAICGIAAIQRLLQKPDAMVEVEYPDTYKKSGFGGENQGELFLKTRVPFALNFGGAVKSEALGGLATPGMAIMGLSRIMGPVSGKPPTGTKTIEQALENIKKNRFDPTDFFQGAKILGGVELVEILKAAFPLAGEEVPKLLSRQSGDRIEARFDWKTPINNTDSKGLFVPNPLGQQTELEMHGLVSSPIDQPAATTFQAQATLVNFRVNLFGFITVWFDRLSFNSKSGAKPDVVVELHPGIDAVAFGGPLEFVNELRKIIPSNGFSDPPNLSVTPSGISASYSLNVPSLAVGIFALEHLSLGAGFSLPFDAQPAEVRFNFCERHRPFSLTVSLLGGGGFLALGVGTEGVREIEAALEFGAALSINLGVASGSVEVKAGVYFHWMQKSVELAGYVRIHGELSVLGLISASLTFNLQLAFLKDNHHSVVWGEASLEVEIEILFLSFSVSVSVRREFGGSDSDPKFQELITDQQTWTDYCEAFATEAA
ncbi:MAG TPA: hypothetical protein VM911_13130 [Pyrinomonadaceae bacterium]|nr:hypothetical protein [Pyrinomonadaceae bacterium]